MKIKYCIVFVEQEDGAEITANSLHPGTVTTNLFRHYSFVEGFSTPIDLLLSTWLVIGIGHMYVYYACMCLCVLSHLTICYLHHSHPFRTLVFTDNSCLISIVLFSSYYAFGLLVSAYSKWPGYLIKLTFLDTSLFNSMAVWPQWCPHLPCILIVNGEKVIVLLLRWIILNLKGAICVTIVW